MLLVIKYNSRSCSLHASLSRFVHEYKWMFVADVIKFAPGDLEI